MLATMLFDYTLFSFITKITNKSANHTIHYKQILAVYATITFDYNEKIITSHILRRYCPPTSYKAFVI